MTDLAWQQEKNEWLEALGSLLHHRGSEQAEQLLGQLQAVAKKSGISLTESLNTPYCNTIPVADQPPYPGNIALETRIENVLRWNAAAMVLQAQDSGTGVGGHIATYASAATMMEVGFNHIFRCASEDYGGDIVHFQAHTAPGIYARAMAEGRLSEDMLKNFRRELAEGGGLPSYPHPFRMPDFWHTACASMGLSTPIAIYQARLAKYLERRQLRPAKGGKVWVHVGDGEADEPEVLGTINVASREQLDNLVLVVNCNLQRLDGPVRGNGKIIQELERSFRGAGWHVIKVIWGSGWDPLFSRDTEGLLQQRMEQALDGDYQMYSVMPGDAVREHWVEKTPELKALMDSLTDEEIKSIKRGGQDQIKIYAAYHEATQITDKPTVILCKTVKGDGLGTAGSNTIHQKKQLSAEERIEFARKLGIPHTKEDSMKAHLYRFPDGSEEARYIQSRRQALGGFIPQRKAQTPSLKAPSLDTFKEFLEGSDNRSVSTTMIMVRMLSRLVRDPQIGRYIVPIVPDEARTFGMDGLCSTAGIYSPVGQQYRPVDAGTIAPYREAENGQVLQEGICEAGAMASFMAVGTAYANYGIPTIPFYIFYSIFGFQRVGDMIWACGDSLCRGFLLGGTSGRTTLNGEGLQHQDGHSQLIASTVPNLKSYDPAFGYELAVIVQEGIYRMYEQQENLFYYLTVTNQNQLMPAAPKHDGLFEQIIRGMYQFGSSGTKKGQAQKGQANLLGSGAIMQEVIKAGELLKAEGAAVNIWSVTSYNELLKEALEVERSNMMNFNAQPKKPFIADILADTEGVFVAATDYMKTLPESISRWIPGPYITLGTDGFGLSESRPELRNWFEVSAPWIAYAALVLLVKEGQFAPDRLKALAGNWALKLDKTNPATAV